MVIWGYFSVREPWGLTSSEFGISSLNVIYLAISITNHSYGWLKVFICSREWICHSSYLDNIYDISIWLALRVNIVNFEPIMGSIEASERTWKTSIDFFHGSASKRSLVDVWPPQRSWGPWVKLRHVNFDEGGWRKRHVTFDSKLNCGRLSYHLWCSIYLIKDVKFILNWLKMRVKV